MLNFKGLGSILMLHRVHPYEHGRIVYNENMKISPNELEEIIEELRGQNARFISLDDLVNVNPSTHHGRKFFVFTLDDGYKDNLRYAYPIFKKHQIPFCIYVTNSFPNRTTNLWWYALEELIIQNDTLIDSKGKLDNKTTRQKNFNFLRLRKQILQRHFLNPLEYLAEFGEFAFDLHREIEEKCLTWEDIRSLSNDPLVTIGCHTMNHYPLSRLVHEHAQAEIINSKIELENQLGKSVDHFAFPFGSSREASHREYRLAKEAAFETVTTTIHGHVYENTEVHRPLRRVFIFPLRDNGTSLSRVLYWNLKSSFAFLRKTIA